jgi:4-carboxymuconolactone decarboxylase
MPDSYLKGLEEIAGTDPENGPLFVEELKRVSPDFAEYFVGFAFGKIHARKVLEPKVKELVAIASLIGIGDGKSRLRLRIMGAVQAGCSKEEVIEVIIQSVVYVGFIRAMVALSLVREVCAEHANGTPNGSAGPPGSALSPAGKSDKGREKPGPTRKPGAGA